MRTQGALNAFGNRPIESRDKGSKEAVIFSRKIAVVGWLDVHWRHLANENEWDSTRRRDGNGNGASARWESYVDYGRSVQNFFYSGKVL